MSKLGEFLLARADTHPEEFYEDRKSGVKHNWLHHVKQNKKFMSEEEYNAIWEKVSAINLDYQMERVTEKLFEPEDEEVFDSTSFGAAVAKVAGQAVNYGQPTKIVANHAQVELIKKQLEYKKAQMKMALETSMFRKEDNDSNTDRR